MRHVHRRDRCHDNVRRKNRPEFSFYPTMHDHHSAAHLHGILVWHLSLNSEYWYAHQCPWFDRLSSLAFESILFALTLVRFARVVRRDYTTGKHTFVYIFIRDGIWAFALIFGTSAALQQHNLQTS